MSTKQKSSRTPTFRPHKGSNQGYVELNGRRFYLGRFDNPATKQRYHAVIAEWIAGGKQMPVSPTEITLTEVCAAFWKHAQDYYVHADGSPTSQQERIKSAIKGVKALYGSAPASAFGPKALRAVREKWIQDGLARTTINSMTNVVKHIIKWAASFELVPGAVYQNVATVPGLRRNRSDAREPNTTTLEDMIALPDFET